MSQRSSEKSGTSPDFPNTSGPVKGLGLDFFETSAILCSAVKLTDKRQTIREDGAQSEGPRPGRLATEVSWIAREFVRIRPASTSHLRDRGVRWLVRPGLFLASLDQRNGQMTGRRKW